MDQHEVRAAEAESLAQAGHWREATEAYAEVVSLGRSDYDIHLNYGMALIHCNRLEAGRDHLQAALRYRPNSLEALNNLGMAHFKLGNPCAAELTCRRILAEQPDQHIAWTNLGVALSDQGRVSEGIEAIQRALEIAPDDRLARDNLLLILNYIATDGDDLALIHRALCTEIPSSPRKPRAEILDRRIRVGYVSADFRSHSVSFFMAGIIGTHDRSAFEVFCYSATHTPDGRTENFIQMAEHFVDLSTCSAAEAARRIEADHIDILVDLGGHTAGNRLDIFALRPAPLQGSYLGYPATTGCSFLDFRMVDALTDPEGSEAYSTEQLVRLPAPFLCYNPHTTFPAIAPLPALNNGYVTFGSFNSSAKISDDTLDLWSRILEEVPGSRLFLKARAFSDAPVCESFRVRFSQRGTDPSRISFSAHFGSVQEHLAAYGQVDIALDTFPYNGATTTCEALWMGVPVISLTGSLHAARVGYTILAAVGLASLATTSADNYVALAKVFSADTDQLADLRSHLQEIVRHSPLCNRFKFTKGLEDAYRKLLADDERGARNSG